MRVDHIAIACRDVERMREWYETVLGFRVVARKEPARPLGQAAYLIGPDASYATLELMADDGESAPVRKAFTQGISHVALAVSGLDDWEARLTAHGVRWLGERGPATGGGFVRSFVDPEGNMLQLVERPAGWRS